MLRLLLGGATPLTRGVCGAEQPSTRDARLFPMLPGITGCGTPGAMAFLVVPAGRAARTATTALPTARCRARAAPESSPRRQRVERALPEDQFLVE